MDFKPNMWNYGRVYSKENFIFEDSMAMLGFGPRTIMTALKVAKEIYQQD